MGKSRPQRAMGREWREELLSDRHTDLQTLPPPVPRSSFQAVRASAQPQSSEIVPHSSSHIPKCKPACLHSWKGNPALRPESAPAFPKAGLNSPLTIPPLQLLSPKSAESKKRMEQDSRSIGISMAPLRLRRQNRTAAWTQGGGCCLAILSMGPRSLLPGLRGLAASSRSNWASWTELSCGKKYNAK